MLRVPLIVSWPGRLPAGVVVGDAVSHIDLLPTLTDLLGIEDSAVRSGRTLAPLLHDSNSEFASAPIVAETFQPESPKDRAAVFHMLEALSSHLDAADARHGDPAPTGTDG